MAKDSDEVKTPEVQPAEAVKPNTKLSMHTVPVWGWVVGAVVVFFAVVGIVAACFSAMRFVTRSSNAGQLTVTARNGMIQRGFADEEGGQYATGLGTRGGFGGRMMGSMGTNSSTRVSGVVTAVDGNTLTVAGDGSSTKVTVSDSTTYSGSSKPAAVNDTIVATGAKASDGSFVAATVRLSRQ